MILLPGPMEGVMSGSFIRAANRLSLFPAHFTPFYRFSAGMPHIRHLRKFCAPFMAGQIPVIVQIMGTDPGLLGEAAAAFASLGAAGIDLNFGCPSRQVTSGGAGGGALRHPERLPELVRAVKRNVPQLPVSAKIRTGWTDPAEMERIIPTLLDGGELSQLTVHFRTVSEQYRPVPNRLNRFQRALALTGGRVPVVINGDFRESAEITATVRELGAAGAMAARGLLRDPWLLRRTAGLSAPEPEAGRQTFFRTVLEEAEESEGGLRPGAAIELSNFIWGAENPYFTRLKAAGAIVKTEDIGLEGTFLMT